MSLESFNRPGKPKENFVDKAEKIEPVQDIQIADKTEFLTNVDDTENKIRDQYAKLRGRLPAATKEQQRAAHPPLEKGREFVPENHIWRVQHMTKDERRIAVPELKEQIAFQKEGMAKIEAELIRKIRINPDATSEELIAQLERSGKVYGLNDEQLWLGKNYIEEYEEKHMAVHAARQTYPDDFALYHHLFDRVPKGKVEIIEGPMTLYVRCFDPEDYAYIYSQAFVTGIEITAEQVAQAQHSGGASIATARDPALRGTIIVENSSIVEKRNLPKFEKINLSENIRIHEEQHAIKKIFGSEHRSYMGWFSEEEMDEYTNGDEETKLTMMRRILERRRDLFAEDRARDEILAYYRDGTSLNDAFAYLTKPREEGGLYDYLATHSPIGVYGESEEFVEKVRKIEKKVYVDDYQSLLQRSMRSVLALEAAGYSKDKVVALLQHEPLSKWTKVAKRQLG